MFAKEKAISRVCVSDEEVTDDELFPDELLRRGGMRLHPIAPKTGGFLFNKRRFRAFVSELFPEDGRWKMEIDAEVERGSILRERPPNLNDVPDSANYFGRLKMEFQQELEDWVDRLHRQCLCVSLGGAGLLHCTRVQGWLALGF